MKTQCGLDYYQIRNGQCKHGETGGHNGEIICDVCKKPEAKESQGNQEEAWAELGDMLMLRNAVLKKLKAKFVLTRKP